MNENTFLNGFKFIVKYNLMICKIEQNANSGFAQNIGLILLPSESCCRSIEVRSQTTNQRPEVNQSIVQ